MMPKPVPGSFLEAVEGDVDAGRGLVEELVERVFEVGFVQPGFLRLFGEESPAAVGAVGQRRGGGGLGGCGQTPELTFRLQFTEEFERALKRALVAAHGGVNQAQGGVSGCIEERIGMLFGCQGSFGAPAATEAPLGRDDAFGEQQFEFAFGPQGIQQ